MNKSVTFTVIVVAFIVLFVAVHEATHVSIYKDYGCSNTSIGLFEGDAFAYVEASCPKDKMEEIRLAQSMVEAVGYQLALPMILLIVLFAARTELS